MQGCRGLTDEEVERVTHVFGGRYAARDRALFITGIRTGYRISELLALRLKDVCTEDGAIYDFITVPRRKTKRKKHGRTVPLHPDAKAAIYTWIQQIPKLNGSMRRDAALFQSRRGVGKSIEYRMALHIFQKAFEEAGVHGSVGTHTMRKTFARRMHIALGRDIHKTQVALGHDDVDSTIHYLATDPEEITRAILEG